MKRHDLSFWKARPLLSQYYDIALARRVCPDALMSVSLAHHATRIEARLMLPPIQVRPANRGLYVVLVASSGLGKSAISVALDLARDVPQPASHRWVGYRDGSPGSGGGLIDLFLAELTESGAKRATWTRVCDGVLALADEWETLESAKKAGGDPIVSVMTSAYTNAPRLGSDFKGRDAKRPPVEAPYVLSASAGLQPGIALKLFNEESVAVGNLQRWSVVAGGRDPRNPGPPLGAWKEGDRLDLRWPDPVGASVAFVEFPTWMTEEILRRSDRHAELAMMHEPGSDATPTEAESAEYAELAISSHDDVAWMKWTAGIGCGCGRLVMSDEDAQLGQVQVAVARANRLTIMESIEEQRERGAVEHHAGVERAKADATDVLKRKATPRAAHHAALAVWATTAGPSETISLKRAFKSASSTYRAGQGQAVAVLLAVARGWVRAEAARLADDWSVRLGRGADRPPDLLSKSRRSSLAREDLSATLDGLDPDLRAWAEWAAGGD